MTSKRKTISSEKKNLIIELYEKQHSQCQMANLLKINQSIVCRIINRYNQCGSVENRLRSGRSPSLSSRVKGRLYKHASKLCSKPAFHNSTSSSSSR